MFCFFGPNPKIPLILSLVFPAFSVEQIHILMFQKDIEALLEEPRPLCGAFTTGGTSVEMHVEWMDIVSWLTGTQLIMVIGECV